MASKKSSTKTKNSEIDEKKSIVRFFSKTEKNPNGKANEKNVSNFIEEKLSSQIANCAAIPNESQAKEIDEKKIEMALISERKKSEKLTSDLKKSVVLIKEISNLNLKKDIEIEALTRQISMVSINSRPSDTLFNEFDGIFQKEQLNKLRSIPSGKSRDSTFVLTCMRFLYPYQNDLLNISVTGRKAKNEKKQKMSQENLEILKKMLKQRLLSEDSLDALSISKRMKNLNKLIKDAIYKIKSPKIQAKKSDDHTAISRQEFASHEVIHTNGSNAESHLMSTITTLPIQSANCGKRKYV